MGRAGSGGGGGHSSGGHSSPTRSSSGHRVGSSNSGGFGSSHTPRAGSGGGPSFSPPTHHETFGGTSFSRPSPPPPPHGYYPPPPPHYRSDRVTYVNSTPASPKAIIATCVCLAALFILVFCLNTGGGSSQSVEMKGLGREKLNASISWNSNCVVDEIDYITNMSATATGLKEFYDMTGMQPYAVFKSYDSSLTSDDMKQSYAEKWYEANISNEATILYMYFEDTDTSVPGYMACIGGSQTKTLWDDLAQDKFWDFIDMYWAMDESVMTTDKLIVQSFVNTGKYVTEKGTVIVNEQHGIVGTLSKIVPFIIVAAVIVLIILIAARVMKLRRAHEKARNEETAAILNAPLDTADHSADDLLDKYK